MKTIQTYININFNDILKSVLDDHYKEFNIKALKGKLKTLKTMEEAANKLYDHRDVKSERSLKALDYLNEIYKKEIDIKKTLINKDYNKRIPLDAYLFDLINGTY